MNLIKTGKIFQWIFLNMIKPRIIRNISKITSIDSEYSDTNGKIRVSFSNGLELFIKLEILRFDGVNDKTEMFLDIRADFGCSRLVGERNYFDLISCYSIFEYYPLGLSRLFEASIDLVYSSMESYENEEKVGLEKLKFLNMSIN